MSSTPYLSIYQEIAYERMELGYLLLNMLDHYNAAYRNAEVHAFEELVDRSMKNGSEMALCQLEELLLRYKEALVRYRALHPFAESAHSNLKKNFEALEGNVLYCNLRREVS